ncbi:hypothetical protein D3C76_1197130 [compost metagenome]
MFAGGGRGADEEAVGLGIAPALQAADHGAGIGVFAFIAEQRFADMEDVAFLAEGPGHHAVVGRGDIHQGLGGFHRDQQLVGLDAVPRLNVPLDDFGFLQAFAQVGQFEVFHRALLVSGVVQHQLAGREDVIRARDVELLQAVQRRRYVRRGDPLDWRLQVEQRALVEAGGDLRAHSAAARRLVDDHAAAGLAH